jgi:hypothetical protein
MSVEPPPRKAQARAGRRRARHGVQSFADVSSAEHLLVRGRRAERGLDENGALSGLALSGGGLRSAAFALGALRALHERGVLQRFDYLSSVSGGGFIAASLVWFSRLGCKLRQGPGELLPRGALEYLRHHANYLSSAYASTSPGGPGSARSVAADRGPSGHTVHLHRERTLGLAVFRGTALSLFVHGSLLVGVFFLLNRLDALVDLLKPALRLLSSRPPWTTLVEYLDFGLLAAGLVLMLALVASILRPLRSTLATAWAESVPPIRREPRRRALKGAVWLLVCMLACALSAASLFAREAGIWAGLVALAAAGGGACAFLRWRWLWRGASAAPAPGAVSHTPLRRAWRQLSLWASAPATRHPGEGQEEEQASFGWLALGLGLLPALVLSSTIAGYVFASGRAAPAEPARLNGPFGVALVIITLGALALALRRVLRSLALLSGVSQRSLPRARRRRERLVRESLGLTLRWAGVLLVLGTVPVFSSRLSQMMPHPGLRLLILGGFVSCGFALVVQRAPAPIGRLPNTSREYDRDWPGLVGGAGLLYAALIFAHVVTLAILGSSVVHLVWVLPLLGLLIGRFTNVNQASPGGAYRERLAEGFLPDDGAVLDNRWCPALSSMGFPLSRAAHSRLAPYPLFNAAVRITGSCDARLQARGADSFLLSPLYCGSSATGYARTDCWVGNDFRLSDAMGVSAAAVAPMTAGPSAGDLGSRLFARALSLLNLRLSFWIHNPKRVSGARPARRARSAPNFLRPLLAQAFRRGPSEDREFIELAGGEHFEELGLYELARRELRLIWVVDATFDPEYEFVAVRQAIERIRVDFGAQVELCLGALAPTAPACGAHAPATSYIIGSIRYANQGESWPLIYLKAPALSDVHGALRGAPGGVGGGHESVADARFGELHFEAQGELGYAVAAEACAVLAALDAAAVKAAAVTGEASGPGAGEPVVQPGAAERQRALGADAAGEAGEAESS